MVTGSAKRAQHLRSTPSVLRIVDFKRLASLLNDVDSTFVLFSAYVANSTLVFVPPPSSTSYNFQ